MSRAAGCSLLVVFALGGCVTSRLPLRAQAHQHLEAGRMEEALPLLQSLHRESPEDLDVARQLTQAQVESGAGKTFFAQLEKTPDEPLRDYMRGLLCAGGIQGLSCDAVAFFEAALRRSPDAGEVTLRLGMAWMQRGEDERALPILRQAAAQLPRDASPWVWVAAVSKRSGHPEEAMAALHRAVDLSPKPRLLLSMRALVEEWNDAPLPPPLRQRLEESLAWLGPRDVPYEAIKGLEAILQEAPEAAQVHALVGLAQQKLDNPSAAIAAFRRAIALAPWDGRNHFYLGELYLSRAKPDAAREALTLALQRHPLHDGACARLGELALERGNLSEAHRFFERLTRLQPEASAPRARLAEVLSREGNDEGAHRELEQVVLRNPGNVEFLLRLGLLHSGRFARMTEASQKQGAAREAQRWLRQVLRLEPENLLAAQAWEQVSRGPM